MSLKLPIKNKRPTLEAVLNFYDACLRHEKMTVVASAFATEPTVVKAWLEKYEDLRIAKDLADERRGKTETFKGYIFDRLSSEAKEIWEKVRFWDEAGSYERIETILAGKSKRLLQELFIHALVCNNFNPSEAMRMIGVARAVYDSWCASDMLFRQLVDEIQWHKKNFFENALVDLVQAGNPGAVIFVNKTVNSDRGYGEKVEVKHTGAVAHVHIDFEKLDLDAETKRRVLEAVRKQKAAIDIPSEALQIQDREKEYSNGN